MGSIWKLAHRDPNRNQRIVRHHVSSTHPIAGRDILTGIEGAAGGGGELDIVVRDARDVDGKMADPEELAVRVPHLGAHHASSAAATRR